MLVRNLEVAAVDEAVDDAVGGQVFADDLDGLHKGIGEIGGAGGERVGGGGGAVEVEIGYAGIGLPGKYIGEPGIAGFDQFIGGG